MAIKSIPNDIFQYSLLSAFHAGLQDGGPPVAFLKNHGDHGIGIFEDGDADMIQLAGEAYSIDKDGNVEPADQEEQLPFVMVTVFQPKERVIPPTTTTSKKLQGIFEANKNTPMPFRLKGSFKYINTQQKTYWDTHGTIFGFSVPDWQAAISGNRLHCVFLSQNKAYGGRIVDFETGDGLLLEYAKTGRFHLGFPQDEEYGELKL